MLTKSAPFLCLLALGLLTLTHCRQEPPNPNLQSPISDPLSSPEFPQVPPSSPSPTPTPSFGAGFRYSTYGPGYDPGPEYWVNVGRSMASRFPGSVPQAIWIVGNVGGLGTTFTFPGVQEDTLIHFMMNDNNEAFFDMFDEIGGQVWLQVEPGNAPMLDCIRIILDRYSHHPSVIGIGVDVEWYKSVDEPEGEAVTDEDARAWLAAARSYNPHYRLFLKHWEAGKMPPTARDGLLFVDDSQGFDSLEHMTTEFAAWGQTFAPAPVAFQFGYPGDQPWWRDLNDPPKEIGERLLAAVPNTEALFWVDFTALQIFPRSEMLPE